MLLSYECVRYKWFARGLSGTGEEDEIGTRLSVRGISSDTEEVAIPRSSRDKGRLHQMLFAHCDTTPLQIEALSMIMLSTLFI